MDDRGLGRMDGVAVRAEVSRVSYTYLRWMLICVPFLLLVVTCAVALQQRRLEASLSAYYAARCGTSSSARCSPSPSASSRTRE